MKLFAANNTKTPVVSRKSSINPTRVGRLSGFVSSPLVVRRMEQTEVYVSAGSRTAVVANATASAQKSVSGRFAEMKKAGR